jgi:hypothetical protein
MKTGSPVTYLRCSSPSTSTSETHVSERDQ